MKTKTIIKGLFVFSFAILSITILPSTTFAERGFSSAVDYATGSTPVSINTGLFNTDAFLDLAVTNSGSNNISILLGNGDGTFDEAINYDTGAYPRSVTLGDFNADTFLDLAVANSNSNNISILLGNGDGTFDEAVNYTVGSNPYSVISGDFDGDTYSDLVVANYSSNTVSILLGNGDGTFDEAVNYTVGSNPYSVISGDFNGDTYPDLAVVNISDNNISILLNIEVIPPVIPEGITRISVSNNGEQGDGDSMNFSSLKTISADGRYTVFNSYATNFTEEEVGTGVYLYDREATDNKLKLISPFGMGPTISDNGMYVAYVELGESGLVIKIYNTDTGVTNTIDLHQSYNELLLQLGEEGLFVCTFSISDNGDILISPGASLVAMIMLGGLENPISIPPIVFYDSSIEEYITIAESENTEESRIFNYSANMSASGNDIIYTQVIDLPTLFTYNILNRQTTQLELDAPAFGFNISSSGQYISFIIFSGETTFQIGVYDTINDSFVISESILENEAIAEGLVFTSISDDGRFVVISQPYIASLFFGGDYTFPSIYIFDSETNELIELVEGEGHFGAYISSDGKYITFSSDSDLLAEGDTNESSDLFLIENPYFEEEQEPAPTRTRTRSSGYASPAMLATFQQEQLQRAINAGLDTTPYQTDQTINTTTPITRTLKLSMTGDDVKALQVYLNTHGYPASLSGAGSLGNETIYFGLKTKQAVIKFQLANMLVGDGIVGKMTREKMK